MKVLFRTHSFPRYDGDVAGIDAGNCDGDGFSGVLRQDDDGDGWRWSLGDLYAPPYCGGTKVAASLSGCYRTSN